MDFSGKIGLWIHNPSTAIGRLHEIRALGFDWIAVKLLDGENDFHPDVGLNLIRDAATIKMPVVPWMYAYPEGATFNPLIKKYPEWIIDAEVEYNDKPHAAELFIERVRESSKCYLSSYYWVDGHSDFPYQNFMDDCDAWMPQAYMEGDSSPEVVYSRIDSRWKPKPTVPTVNTPELLLGMPVIYTGCSVWLWDGTGVPNSQIKNPGNDEGVVGLKSEWSKAIYAWKNKRNIIP